MKFHWKWPNNFSTGDAIALIGTIGTVAAAFIGGQSVVNNIYNVNNAIIELHQEVASVQGGVQSLGVTFETESAAAEERLKELTADNARLQQELIARRNQLEEELERLSTESALSQQELTKKLEALHKRLEELQQRATMSTEPTPSPTQTPAPDPTSAPNVPPDQPSMPEPPPDEYGHQTMPR